MKSFEERYAAALEDSNIRTGLLPFQRSWRIGRDERMSELEAITGRSFESLRHEFAEYKAEILARWPHYIDEFKRNAEAAGATVAFATTPAEACAYVTKVTRERGASLVIKGKIEPR